MLTSLFYIILTIPTTCAKWKSPYLTIHIIHVLFALLERFVPFFWPDNLTIPFHFTVSSSCLKTLCIMLPFYCFWSILATILCTFVFISYAEFCPWYKFTKDIQKATDWKCAGFEIGGTSSSQSNSLKSQYCLKNVIAVGHLELCHYTLLLVISGSLLNYSLTQMNSSVKTQI